MNEREKQEEISSIPFLFLIVHIDEAFVREQLEHVRVEVLLQ